MPVNYAVEVGAINMPSELTSDQDQVAFHVEELTSQIPAHAQSFYAAENLCAVADY